MKRTLQPATIEYLVGLSGRLIDNQGKVSYSRYITFRSKLELFDSFGYDTSQFQGRLRMVEESLKKC